jgi:hypothetical protein
MTNMSDPGDTQMYTTDEPGSASETKTGVRLIPATAFASGA